MARSRKYLVKITLKEVGPKILWTLQIEQEAFQLE